VADISRREFVTRAGIAAGAYGYLAAPAVARPNKRRHKRRARTFKGHVAVLGGGVGGLTAAHELAERGFKVTVIEPKALGGKARSIPVAGTGTSGRANLPGEHGFRFFPGFYKNIPNTMRRIPVSGNANGAFDNLLNASQELLIFNGNQQFYTPPTLDTMFSDYVSLDQNGITQAVTTIVTMMGIGAGVPMNEMEYFIRKLLVFMTSCDERREGEWENVGWYDYVNAANFSPEYQRVFGTGLTKDLVAAKGTKASTRVIGLMAEAFVYDVVGQFAPGVSSQSGYGDADRLLDAPTNEAWIDPWVAHLASLGVEFHLGYRATSLKFKGSRIVSAVLRRGRSHATLDADAFICGMPVEQMVKLLDNQLLAADPSLEKLHDLQTDWMNGIQYFLSRPPSLKVKGHVAFLETPWSLSAIDQGLFWKRDIAAQYGAGNVNDIYSVDISDFFTPGVVYNKPAADCTPQEISREVWEQMKQELNNSSETALSDDMIVTWFLDPAISYPNGPGAQASNAEPLLINTTGSLADQPNAQTQVPNLFLASDYVRTNISLATMEGANEAGRQAANALLAQSGSGATPATLGTLWQPSQLDSSFALDQQRYRAGQSNALDTLPADVPL
jgi:uncharacterized protein with NAD-binding domain and iron-sulfur cluster